MSFGECTVMLQDVAYQLELLIDGQYVSGCLTNFEWYIKGGRPTWAWFEELLAVIPPPDCIDKFTVKCTWMQQMFSDLPEGVDEETVWRYARAYIMMLLPTQLFSYKSGTRMYIRWLPYVVRLEDMDSYSWGSTALSWLHRCLFRVANKNVVKLAGPLQLLQSWIFWRFSDFRPDGFDAFHWLLASMYAIDY
ncbi:protein MAIN-LIKE 2-like [Arachis hypogaea]|uniref:protein MAIN-LIKE 2-like n=1 Tax=Arachis hypogaea TaxID=3818 RepID=UPI003B21B023